MSDKPAAPWTPPQQTGAPGPLMVHNSLTKSNVPFYPMNGNTVKWYTCGPTVYDSAHLGHARAAVTFDIIRRIMQDYFNYNIFFVMNITDVEDKIILRARRDHYVSEYAKKATDLPTVIADARAALDKAIASTAKAVADAEKDLAAAPPRFVDDLTDRVKQTTLKAAQAVNARSSFDAIAAAAVPGPEGIASIIAVAHSALGSSLDAAAAAAGANAVDHSIFKALTERYEKEYFEDLQALGVRDVDALTRVTEYIPQIVSFVEKIVAKGLAYDDGTGSVYFDTVAFQTLKGDDGAPCHCYGKLNPAGVGNAALAAEGEGELAGGVGTKKHPHDFALWKASRPGEPQWPSPWGPGRPGWHIECSVMASDVLGEQFDIHTGGEDLKFPHHDNEMAQSEAHSGRPQWINYFLHAGHLHIQGLKMSKSLKNFITIRQALSEYTARQIRILFLMQRWDARMNYGDESLADACNRERTLKEFFLNIRNEARAAPPLYKAPQPWTATDAALREAFDAAQNRIHAALLDNFDHVGAMSEIFALVSTVNKYLAAHAAAPGSSKVLLLKGIAAYVDRMLKVFGVVRDEEASFLDALSGDGGAGAGAAVEKATRFTEAVIDRMCVFRDNIRAVALNTAPESIKREVMSACDELRDGPLPLLGVRLEDKPTGAVWKRDSPAELVKQIADKKLQPLKKKLILKLDLLPKAKLRAATPYEDMHRTAAYSAWDDAGVPTHTKAGDEVEPAARKKLASAQALRKKSDEVVKRAMAAAKVEDAKVFLEQLNAEIKDFEDKIGAVEAELAATLEKVKQEAV